MTRGALVLLFVVTVRAQPGVDPVHLRAWQLLGQGHSREAIPLLQGLIDVGRGTEAMTALLAEAFVVSHNEPAAELYFRKKLERNSSDVLARLGLVLVFAAAGRVAAAQEEARICARSQPLVLSCIDYLAESGRVFSSTVSTEQAVGRLIPLDPDRAESRYALEMFQVTWDEPDSAIKTGEVALRLAREREDPVLLAKIEYLLAAAYGKKGQDGAPRALEHAREACRFGRQIGDPEAEFGYCGTAAAQLLVTTGTDDSEFQALIQRARSLQNPKKEAGLEHALASTLAGVGRIEDALDHLDRAVQVRSPLPEDHGLSMLFRLRGAYQARLGAYEAAVSSFEEALKADDAQRQPVQRAHVMSSLTVAHNQAGNALEAIRTAQEAVRLFRQTGHEWQAGAELSDIGAAFLTLGDIPTAAQYFRASLRSAHRFRDPGEIVRNSNLLAAAHLGEGRAELARRELLPLMTIMAEGREPRFQARSHTLLGEAESQLGHYESALRYLTSALEEVAAAGDAWLEADAWVTMGRHRLRTGQMAEADRAFRAALAIAEPGMMKQEMQAALSGLAEVARRRDHPEQALEWLRKAVDSLESLRSAAPGPELRAGLMQRNSMVFSELIQTAIRLQARHPDAGYDKLALTYSERGRARVLLDLLEESRAGLKVGLTPAQAARQRSLEKNLSAAVSKQRTNDTAATRVAVQHAERDMRQWSTELRVENPRFHDVKYPEPLDAEGVRRLAREKNVTIVEYALGRSSSRVWVADADGLYSAPVPSATVVTAAVHRLRKSLTKHPAGPAVEDYRGPARELDRMLIGPIRAHIGKSTGTIIVPDGILHYLPFEVLMEPDGRFLIERTTVSYAPSASVVAELERGGVVKARRELLALGNPDFGTMSHRVPGNSTAVTRDVYRAAGLDLRPLPGTETEVRSIATLFASPGTRLLLGRQASETVLKSEPLGEFRRLHLATHALIDERAPARSGLVLSLVDTGKEDGVLQLNEIMALPLDADLVTLSACQTGLGTLVRGEGMVGFTRAFLFAGARRLAVSLWPVNDVATPELMDAFYRALRDGAPPSVALRFAKLQMLKSPLPAYRHPHYWAGFVLTGAR